MKNKQGQALVVKLTILNDKESQSAQNLRQRTSRAIHETTPCVIG